MSSSLQQYFTYKNEYLQKYSKYKEFKLFDVTATNMPINFYETDKKYIVEIIDADDRDKVYYRKTIPNPSNVINLSYLQDKLKNDLDKMNIDYNKTDYLHKINQIEKEKNDLIAINNTLLQPADNITLKLNDIENELQLITSTFTEWLKSVENIFLQMEIIQTIYNEKIQNDNNNINEYSIKYHWLNNKINNTADDSHYIILKLHTQGIIKNINDIIKYANEYYIIKSLSSNIANIQNLRTSNIIDVSITDILHEPGSYIIFKDYTLSNGSIITITDDVYKLPTENIARFILSQLTYQEEKWLDGHIVMYNNNWYKINSLISDTNTIKIQSIDDIQILDIDKNSLIHPTGYRNKYTKVNQTDELILPVNKWIDTFSNTNQYYINNKELYQGPELKKNSIVRYNDNWHVVISISHPTITIRNLENKTDIQPKIVSINDVTYKEGYYNKYKHFKYTTELIIPMDEWINTLRPYNILLDDSTDLITETTEYPANNMSNRYLRVETPEQKEIKIQKIKLREEKKEAKLATMTEEEKQLLLLKKEAAKKKRTETLKAKKEKTDTDVIDEQIEKQQKQLKKTTSKKDKVKIEDIEEKTNITLSTIKSTHLDYITKINESINNKKELAKLIRELGNYAKSVLPSVINTNKEAVKYIRTIIVPDIQKFSEELHK